MGWSFRIPTSVRREVPRRQQFRYDAFISYHQHSGSDAAVAIQRALHRLAKPWYKLRALRTFRDSSSISASDDLWGTIARALELIGACSSLQLMSFC